MSKKYIIDDLGKGFSFPGVVVLNADLLTTGIVAWVGWQKLDQLTTRVIFLGNGAQDVKRRLSEEWLSQWKTEELSASRFWWHGCGPPEAVVETPRQLDFFTTDVVVVDDVVSSGSTMRKVRERWMPFLPRARNWYALSWVAQRSAQLRGYMVYAPEMVGDGGTKVPVNSLSTLLEDRQMGVNYAKRNFPDCHETFLAALEELR